MAIWQFKVLVIPESALRGKFGTIPVSLTRDLAERFDWWSDCQPPIAFTVAIDTMLPEIKSWSRKMRIWGDERGDAAVVCYDDRKNVIEIEFRIDVRQVSLSFIRGICEFAKRLECVLVTNANHLLAPDESLVLAAINNSTAKKYLEDPVSMLRDLKGKIPGSLDKE